MELIGGILILFLGLALVGGCIYYLLFVSKPDPNSNLSKEQRLGEKYSPSMSRFQARKERKSVDERATLMAALTIEKDMVNLASEKDIKAQEIEVQSQYAGKGVHRGEEQAVLMHANTSEVIKEATKEKMTVDTLVEKQRVEIEINKVERLADSDQKREFEKMREQVRLSMIAHQLTEHQKVTLIIEMLDLMYKEIQQIQDDPVLADTTKQRMIQDREEFIVSLKKDRKKREGRLSEDRLVQGGRQKGLRAGDEAAKLRGDYREKS
jgi:hypothetical protein